MTKKENFIAFRSLQINEADRHSARQLLDDLQEGVELIKMKEEELEKIQQV